MDPRPRSKLLRRLLSEITRDMAGALSPSNCSAEAASGAVVRPAASDSACGSPAPCRPTPPWTSRRQPASRSRAPFTLQPGPGSLRREYGSSPPRQAGRGQLVSASSRPEHDAVMSCHRPGARSPSFHSWVIWASRPATVQRPSGCRGTDRRSRPVVTGWADVVPCDGDRRRTTTRSSSGASRTVGAAWLGARRNEPWTRRR